MVLFSLSVVSFCIALFSDRLVVFCYYFWWYCGVFCWFLGFLDGFVVLFLFFCFVVWAVYVWVVLAPVFSKNAAFCVRFFW